MYDFNRMMEKHTCKWDILVKGEEICIVLNNKRRKAFWCLRCTQFRTYIRVVLEIVLYSMVQIYAKSWFSTKPH